MLLREAPENPSAKAAVLRPDRAKQQAEDRKARIRVQAAESAWDLKAARCL